MGFFHSSMFVLAAEATSLEKDRTGVASALVLGREVCKKIITKLKKKL